MSEAPGIFGFNVPQGRRLDPERGGLPENVLGNISQFPRATPQRIEAARKNMREIPDERLDRSTDPWTDRETGETYRLLRGFLNIVGPAPGVSAFTISDGNLIGLRSAGYEETTKSVFVGNLTHGGPE